MIAIEASDSGSSSSAAFVIEAFTMVWSSWAWLMFAFPSTVPVRAVPTASNGAAGIGSLSIAASATAIASALTAPAAAVGICNAAASRDRNSLSACPCAPSALMTPTAISYANWRESEVVSGATTETRSGFCSSTSRYNAGKSTPLSGPSASVNCLIEARSRSSLSPSANAAISATVRVARVCAVSMRQR